jgi:hypothetical protein
MSAQWLDGCRKTPHPQYALRDDSYRQGGSEGHFLPIFELGETKMAKPTEQRSGPDAGAVDHHASIDQRHQGYIALYCNLDTLGWNSQATLMAISLLGLGALGVTLEKSLALGGLSRNDTVAAIFFLLGVMYANTVFAAWRMRAWHKRLEGELMALEPSGYFHARQKDRRGLLSARLWSSLSFGFIAIACLAAGAYFWFRP